MKEWVIVSPEGTTLSPNEKVFENFQVLGFVHAESNVAALKKLKEENQHISGSGFDEVWIYQLSSERPYIYYLGNDAEEEEFEDERVKKIINVIKDIGYFNIVFDYKTDNSYYFEGYSDTYQEIRVDFEIELVKVYDRYIGEKHFVHMGNFKLTE
jgi:hypothetical protein